MAQNKPIRKKYKNLILFLVCLVIIKIAFAFFGSRYSISVSFVSNLFTSALNTENVVSLTNASRKRAGFKELKISKRLEDAATQKAEDMLKNQYFAHITPYKKTPWDFMEDEKYAFLFAGENLAINFNSAEEVTTGWLTSPDHKENILNNKYTEMGVGIAEGQYLGAHTTIVVQMFGKPLKSSALISKLPMKKSRKVASPMKRKSLLAQSFLKPTVQGISVGNYIAELEDKKMAVWNPKAKIHQIYSVPENSISAQSLLNILYAYLVASSIGIIIYRYFKKRDFQSKTLNIFTILVVSLSLALAAF